MFTGIITAIGEIAVIDGAILAVACPSGWLGGAKEGDSIAVNGVCLTAEKIEDADSSGAQFFAHLSPETRSRIAPFSAGGKVNLERSLCVGDSLGGHFVTGHIDGTATVAEISDAENCRNLRLIPPENLMRYFAPKGSAAIHGVSLTINEIFADGFCVQLIPATLARTNLGDVSVGEKINAEADCIARYIESLLIKGA